MIQNDDPGLQLQILSESQKELTVHQDRHQLLSLRCMRKGRPAVSVCPEDQLQALPLPLAKEIAYNKAISDHIQPACPVSEYTQWQYRRHAVLSPKQFSTPPGQYLGG